ncbi:MAG: ABC transporter permease [Ktedonobacteraceae bacterium]
MLRFILQRLLAAIPSLILISAFVFFIGQYGAGDLAAYLTAQQSGGRFDQHLYVLLQHRLQLDQPAYVRYGQWVAHALQGDLGISYVSAGAPGVNYLISQALPITLEISLAAMVLVIVIGVPAGIIAAVFRNSPLDYMIVGIATLLSSVPLFVLAPLAVYFLVLQVHIIPYVGLNWHGIFSQQSILPVIILAANSSLTTVRFTRASVIEVLSQEYIRAARAKGLPYRKVIIRHVLKNALIPVLSVVGLTAAYLLGGSLFLEIVFNLRGFGLLADNALQGGDLQLMTGIILVTAFLIIGINLITDILYSLVDPRIQLNN